MGESRESQNVALGRAIQKLREEAGLTQEELAERAQMPLSELRLVEAGEVDADWGTLRHLAYGLERSLADVFRLAEFDHAEEQQQDQGDRGRDQ
ncbi:MAG TPA: helix-turn-helix transcriptional regulator [Solirubrobacterales bacterium]|nr:helix-turn-helix transcriptional regulator [Solirubrobacterales bacterium]